MSQLPNNLTCTKVVYYSMNDEEVFFWWLEKIKCIERIDAIRYDLYLHLKKTPPTDEDLQDLIGLFYRYNVDMKQLARFLTPENKAWFYDDKKAFWHKKVFGSKEGKS